MDRWRGRVALVTGASVGIGAAIVRALVSHGMKVVGCARDVAKIQAIADELSGESGSLLAIRCDLRKEDDILTMFSEIKKEYGGVDVCINNAGLRHEGASLLSGETKYWRDMLEVNVLATTICTRESYQSMKERGVDDGHIILFNSLAGHIVIPKTSFYSGSKFAITALAEGLRNELRQANSHIRITSISPGIVETEFVYRAVRDNGRAKDWYKTNPCLQASDIVDVVTFVLGAPPHVQYTETKNIKFKWIEKVKEILTITGFDTAFNAENVNKTNITRQVHEIMVRHTDLKV